MRFGAFFWDWLARRVFSPNPHATVVFFGLFSSPDTHTRTRKMAVWESKKGSYRAGSGKKEGAQSVRQSQARVNIYGLSIGPNSQTIWA